MIATEADVVIEEWELAGREVEQPLAALDDEAPLAKQYAPEVWAEARNRWDGYSADEQKKKKDDYVAQMKQFMNEFEDTITETAFSENFSGWDLLWFGLAAYTAFQLGSGKEADA